MKTYDKSSHLINAKPGEEFLVELESVPGYQWDAHVDGQKLEIVKKEFVPPNGTRIGGSGTDVFTFKSLTGGDSELRFVYKRPWENAGAETFEIKVRAE